jgi:hypothetical protein
MSDDLLKRLEDPPFGTETSERKLMAQAAAALVAKDAEIARLLGLLREAEELTDAAIDPRHGSKADWDWRDAVLARIGAELAAGVKG